MNIRKITVTGLMIAISVLLPMLFHMIGGQGAGRVFLPMHIGVFLTGLIAGGWYGIIAGLITPVLGFGLLGMPMPPVMFFMMAELAAYGAVSGFVRLGERAEQTRWAVYIKLVIAMIAGRVFGGLVMAAAAAVFALPINAIDAVIASFITGLPGIAIQLVLIPAVYLILKRGGYLFESRTA